MKPKKKPKKRDPIAAQLPSRKPGPMRTKRDRKKPKHRSADNERAV